MGRLEFLAVDFKGHTDLVDIVLDAPRVFAHKPRDPCRASRQVRVKASYPRSYKISARARRGAARRPLDCSACGVTARSRGSPPHVAKLGVDIVTLGQYLSPSKQALCDIARYVHQPRSSSSSRPTRAARASACRRRAARAIGAIHADGRRSSVRGTPRRRRPRPPHLVLDFAWR